MKGSLTYLESSPLKASLVLRLLPSFLLHTTEKLQQKLEKNLGRRLAFAGTGNTFKKLFKVTM